MAKQETAKFQKAQLNTTAFYRCYRDIYLNFGTNKGNNILDSAVF